MFQHFGAYEYQTNHQGGGAHPQKKWPSLEEIQELIQGMGGFPDGAEGRNQQRADADENSACERISGKGFTENEGRKYGVEH